MTPERLAEIERGEFNRVPLETMNVIGELIDAVRNLHEENARLVQHIDDLHEGHEPLMPDVGQYTPRPVSDEMRKAICTDGVPAMLEAARRAGEEMARQQNEIKCALILDGEAFVDRETVARAVGLPAEYFDPANANYADAMGAARRAFGR